MILDSGLLFFGPPCMCGKSLGVEFLKFLLHHPLELIILTIAETTLWTLVVQLESYVNYRSYVAQTL